MLFWRYGIPGITESYKEKHLTAKKLIQEIVVCRYGIPGIIESDRGKHFLGKIMKEILTAFSLEQCLLTPYNPAASDKIENIMGCRKRK